jgi:hypothetical protein
VEPGPSIRSPAGDADCGTQAGGSGVGGADQGEEKQNWRAGAGAGRTVENSGCTVGGDE